MTADQATATAEPVGARAGTEPPRLTGPQPLTDALIDAVGTSGCGWSRKQIEILGASWPLEGGWRERIVAEGRTLSAEQVEALYDARKKAKRPENPNGPDDSLVPTPCPWCRRLVEPVTQGGHTREFCSRKHKTLFNAALTTASIEHSRLLRIPGALKSWTERRVHPWQSGDEGSPRATGGPGSQDGPLAAPRDSLE